MNIYWTWSYSRPRSYTNVQTTDGVNYVTKLESKWSVTYGERLQMAPASATDVPWMCFFRWNGDFPIEMRNLYNVGAPFTIAKWVYSSNVYGFWYIITSYKYSNIKFINQQT
jgi:hypothetical protein